MNNRNIFLTLRKDFSYLNYPHKTDMHMKDIEPVTRSAEEFLEESDLFQDSKKIQNTLELLLECYLSSHVIDIHRRSERETIYNHVDKLKDFLGQGKIYMGNMKA